MTETISWSTYQNKVQEAYKTLIDTSLNKEGICVQTSKLTVCLCIAFYLL